MFKHDISNDMLFKHMKYAIVKGTYSQLYGGTDIYKYSLYLVGKNNKIYNACSWHHETRLKQVKKISKNKAEEMIEEYNTKEWS